MGVLPSTLAAQEGHEDVVELLLEEKADPNIQNEVLPPEYLPHTLIHSRGSVLVSIIGGW